MSTYVSVAPVDVMAARSKLYSTSFDAEEDASSLVQAVVPAMKQRDARVLRGPRFNLTLTGGDAVEAAAPHALG